METVWPNNENEDEFIQDATLRLQETSQSGNTRLTPDRTQYTRRPSAIMYWLSYEANLLADKGSNYKILR